MADLIDKAAARNAIASVQEWSPYPAGSTESAAWIKGATTFAENADAAIAALPAQGVRVKPLEWRDAKISDQSVRETSETPLGTYEVLRWSTGDFGGSLPSAYGEENTEYGEMESIDAAKAAAQADYERRILAALAPAEAGGVGDREDFLAWLDSLPKEPNDKLKAAFAAYKAAVTPAPVDALVKAALLEGVRIATSVPIEQVPAAIDAALAAYRGGAE